MLHFCLGRRREREEHEEFLGREIHDGACQYVSAARMMFETYRHERTEAGPENWYSFDMGASRWRFRLRDALTRARR
jgi:signal transduction histidine kinase